MEITDSEAALSRLAEKTELLRKRSAAITAEKLELEAARNRQDKLMQEKNSTLLELERNAPVGTKKAGFRNGREADH